MEGKVKMIMNTVSITMKRVMRITNESLNGYEKTSKNQPYRNRILYMRSTKQRINSSDIMDRIF